MKYSNFKLLLFLSFIIFYEPSAMATRSPEFLRSQIIVNYNFSNQTPSPSGQKIFPQGWLLDSAQPLTTPHIYFQNKYDPGNNSDQPLQIHHFAVYDYYGIWDEYKIKGYSDVTIEIEYQIPQDCTFVQVAFQSHLDAYLYATILNPQSNTSRDYIFKSKAIPFYDFKTPTESSLSKENFEGDTFYNVRLLTPSLQNYYFPDLQTDYFPFSNTNYDPNNLEKLMSLQADKLSAVHRNIIPTNPGEILTIRLKYLLKRKEKVTDNKIIEYLNDLYIKPITPPKPSSLAQSLETFKNSWFLPEKLAAGLYILDQVQKPDYTIQSQEEDTSMSLRDYLASQITKKEDPDSKIYAHTFLQTIRKKRENINLEQEFNDFINKYEVAKNIIEGTSDNKYLAELNTHLLKTLIKQQQVYLLPKIQQKLEHTQEEINLNLQIKSLLNIFLITLNNKNEDDAKEVLEGLKNLLELKIEQSSNNQDLQDLLKIIDHNQNTQSLLPISTASLKEKAENIENKIRQLTMQLGDLKAWLSDLKTWEKLNLSSEKSNE